METQKMTTSGVKEMTRGKPAAAGANEAPQSAEAEFARLLGALFSGQSVAQADAFDALKSSPQLTVAKPAPAKEDREIHQAKEGRKTNQDELGCEEAAPKADQADDEAGRVDDAAVKADEAAVKADEAAVKAAQSAASSVPSGVKVDSGEKAAETAPAVVDAGEGDAARQAQAQTQVQAQAGQTETASEASDAATAQAFVKNNSADASAQRGAKPQQSQEQAVNRESKQLEQHAPEKPVQAVEPEAEAASEKKASRQDVTQPGLSPERSAGSSDKGGEPVNSVSLGTQPAVSASSVRADHAAMHGAQAVKAAAQQAAPAAQAPLDAVQGKLSAVQSANGAVNAPGLGSTEETPKKGANAAKGTAAAEAKKQAQIIEQIQKVLDTAAKSKDGNTMIVRLDPPELGTLTIKMTQRGDQLFARVVPESAEVEQTLRDRVPEMTQMLAANGFKTENVQVSIGTERSESESFCFNQSQQGSRGRQEGEGFGRRDNPEQLVLREAPSPEKLSRMLEPGWVA